MDQGGEERLLVTINKMQEVVHVAPPLFMIY